MTNSSRPKCANRENHFSFIVFFYLIKLLAKFVPHNCKTCMQFQHNSLINFCVIFLSDFLMGLSNDVSDKTEICDILASVEQKSINVTRDLQ